MLKTKLIGACTALLMIASPMSALAAEGWQEIDGGWKYETNGEYIKGEWKTISGRLYYFDEEGWMQTGWRSQYNTWYYLDSSGAAKTGWLKWNNSWYYFNSTGAMQQGWIKDQEQYYWMKPDGIMESGSWIKTNGNWYYVDSSGAAKSGWLQTPSGWYYLNPGSHRMETDSWIAGGNGADDYYVNAKGIWSKSGNMNDLTNAPEGLKTIEPLLHMDQAPVHFLDKGWVVMVDGKYGFIDPDGHFLIDPVYERCGMYIGGISSEMSDHSGFWVTFQHPDGSDSKRVDENGVSDGLRPGFGGSVKCLPYVNAQQKVVNYYFPGYYEGSDDPYISEDLSQYNTDLVNIVIESLNEQNLPSHNLRQYIWRSRAGQLYGPYEPADAFTSQKTAPSPETFGMIRFSIPQGIIGPFGIWSQDGWDLSKQDTETIKENFERLEFIQPEATAAFDAKGSFTVFDSNLNPLYASTDAPDHLKLQDGSGVLNGKAFVKADGCWYMMDIQ